MDSEPKARRTTPAKDVRGDSATFTEFMRKLIAVPHAEIKAEMEADKAEKRMSIAAFLSRLAGSKEGH
jgi:hypothetical protein